MRYLYRGLVATTAGLLLTAGLASPALAAPEDCSLSISDATGAETDGDSTMTFTITATSGVTNGCDGVTVNYFTADDTGDNPATAGEDYVAVEDGSWAILDGAEAPGASVSEPIEITITGDTRFEPSETFLVIIEPADPEEATATDDEGTGTITNDDPGIGAGGALAISPASGDPGTVITVSGTECGADSVDVFLSASSGESGGIIEEKTVAVADDGSWSTTVTVPSDADPDAKYTVAADCNGDVYEFEEFDVTGLADGYRMVAADGGVFVFGDRVFAGSLGDRRLNKPIVGGATNPDTYAGYWMVASDGGIFNFGDAGFYGSLGDQALTSPIVEIEPTPSGKGYFLVDATGRVFPFGDAPKDIPDARSITLNKSVIGMTVTPSGEGYWLVASDGGIFNFGDAPFYGSTGNLRLNAPIIDLGATPDGKGYYLVGGDGGIFTFGSAEFKGSTGDIKLNKPAVAMLVAPTGAGYWIIASDGGVFTFGAVPFLGSTGNIALNSPILDAVH